MDLIKGVIAIAVILFLLSFFFNFLFKIGIITLLALGIVYLYQQITKK